MSNEEILTAEELAALLQDDTDQDADSLMGMKLKLVLGFPLEVSVRLGSAQRAIGELLNLSSGTVIELDRLISDPVELLVNGKTFARGEVITIGEYFGIKITSIIKPEERLENLR